MFQSNSMAPDPKGFDSFFFSRLIAVRVFFPFTRISRFAMRIHMRLSAID